MIQPCKKCGATWVSGRYDRQRDLIVFNCACGFRWSDLPLDASPDRRNKHECVRYLTRQFNLT